MVVLTVSSNYLPRSGLSPTSVAGLTNLQPGTPILPLGRTQYDSPCEVRQMKGTGRCQQEYRLDNPRKLMRTLAVLSGCVVAVVGLVYSILVKGTAGLVGP